MVGGNQWCSTRETVGWWEGRGDPPVGCGFSRRQQQGTRKGNDAQTRGLPVVKQYLRERLMSKNTDIDYSL